MLCDSNVLEPWLDSCPHPATLLPNRRLKSGHSAGPPSNGEDSALFTDLWEGWVTRKFQKTHVTLHGASCPLMATQSHALSVGLAGPAALCSAGRAAGPRTQCSRKPVQHHVGVPPLCKLPSSSLPRSRAPPCPGLPMAMTSVSSQGKQRCVLAAIQSAHTPPRSTTDKGLSQTCHKAGTVPTGSRDLVSRP